MVEVNDPPLFGVIRWIGWINGISEPVAGIELVRTVCASVFIPLLRLYTHTTVFYISFLLPRRIESSCYL